MRKFFISLFILLILGGTGFFFGWAQFGVPPGSFGVIRSKTHGLDPQIIREGEFRWVWYKLIPTNASIDIYKPNRIERQTTFKDSLPSGDVYATFTEIRADFSYELDITLSFSISADALVSLISEKNISGQADLEAFEESLARDVEAFILRHLNAPEESEISSILATGSSPALEEAAAKNFPYIENFSCRIGTTGFPDYRLYQQIRAVYEDYVAKQREYLNSSPDKNPETRINFQVRIDELARYGELLTKYPLLLEYLNLEQKR
jgi:hypothetical protein